MRWAAGAYALAFGALLAAACWAGGDGLRLMGALNAVLAGVALGIMVALGPAVWRWLPARLMAVTGAALGVLALAQAAGGLPASAGQGVPALALALAAALAMVGLGAMAGPDLRQALRR